MTNKPSFETLKKNLFPNSNDKSNISNRKLSSKKSNTVENDLPFDNVIDNIIKIDDTRYRMIARTNAISIDDMDSEDKETILEIYSDWLNGITKAYQTYIPSFTLDIREHLNKLEDRMDEDPELEEWISDDIELQKKLMEENDIIDTQFYFVFQIDIKPSDNSEKDLLAAKKILSKQIKYASDELEGIGLNLHTLSKNEIGRLFYFCLNPFSAGTQEPNFDDNLVTGMNFKVNEGKLNLNKKKLIIEEENTKVFEFKEGNSNYLETGALDFKQKIAPYSINDKEDGNYIKIGSTYMTVFEIYDYPKKMPSLWAKKLYKFKNNIDVSIHTKPIKTSEIANELEKASVNYGSATVDLKTGDKRKARTMVDKKMEETENDIDKIMDALGSADQGFFHFSMYVLAKARTLDELEDLCLELENILGGMRVLFRRTSENMKNAIWTIFPFGLDILNSTRNMLTHGVSNAFPFTNFSFSHKSGFFLGTHKRNLTFTNFNPFELENANGVVLGTSGAGKTVTTDKIVKGLTTVLDANIRVIDPEGEMMLFAESINGEVFDYYPGSNHILNIMEVEPDDEIPSLIKPHINFLKVFFSKAIELEKADRNKIDYSLRKFYNQHGFYDDKETYFDDKRFDEGLFHMGRPRRKPPELLYLAEDWYNNKWESVIGETKHLGTQLYELTRKGSIDMFDGQTNVNFKNKRIFFNLKHLDKHSKDIAVFALYHKLWDLVRRNPDILDILYTEEAHTLIRNDDMGEYSYDINKRIRKYKGSSIMTTQNPTDFLKTKWGPEIMKNCSWSILMKQKAGEDIDILRKIYEMLPSEANRMTKFNRDKGECYLVADGYRVPLNIRVSEKELATFKPSKIIR